MADDPVKVGHRDPLQNLLSLRVGPLVAIDDARAQGAPVGIDRRAAHHLAAQRDAGDLTRIDVRNQFSGRSADGPPPVVRLLLGPVAVKIPRRIAARAAGHQPPFVREQGGLVAGSAQVVSQKVSRHGDA